MTRTHTFAAIAALALSFVASAASAGQEIPATWANEQVQPFVSTVTRAQVLAELQAARQSGELNPFDTLAYHQATPAGTSAQAHAAVAAR